MEEQSSAPADSRDTVKVACKCLNVQLQVVRCPPSSSPDQRAAAGESGEVDGEYWTVRIPSTSHGKGKNKEEDERSRRSSADGGEGDDEDRVYPLIVQHPQLVALSRDYSGAYSSTASSAARPSASSSGTKNPRTLLRCLHCQSTLLSFDLGSPEQGTIPCTLGRNAVNGTDSSSGSSGSGGISSITSSASKPTQGREPILTSLIVPVSCDGDYRLHTKNVIIGEQAVAERRQLPSPTKQGEPRSAPTNGTYSPFFGIVFDPTELDVDQLVARATGEEGDEDDVNGYQQGSSSPSMSRSSSPDTVVQSPPEQRRSRQDPFQEAAGTLTKTLASTTRSSGGPALATPSSTSSPFHAAARTKLRQERNEMEAKIAKMRQDLNVRSKVMLKQADLLASRLPTQQTSETNGRSTSRARGERSTSRSRSAQQGESTGTNRDARDKSAERQSGGRRESATSPPPTVVMRGGFDSPSTSNATSPSPSGSFNPLSSTRQQPQQPQFSSSPYLAATGNFPTLFGSLGKSSYFRNPADRREQSEQEPKTSKENKEDQSTGQDTQTSATKTTVTHGFAQPAGPQEATYRRSRSPSPSRDTSVVRDAASSTTAPIASAATSTKAKQASTSKTEGKKKDSSAQQKDRGRARAAVPMASSLKTKTAQFPPIPTGSGIMSASLPYKARSPWLRLNAVSPSPPRTRDGVPEIGTAANATKDSNLDKHTDASQAGDARTGRAAEDSSVSPSARPSLSKDGQKRHVSFIEPDTSTKEAEGGPEAAIDTRVPVEDPEETVFDLDEEIEPSSEEDEAEDDLLQDAPSAPTIDPTGRASASPVASTREAALSPRKDKSTDSERALNRLLNNPNLFGSLRSGSLSKSPYFAGAGSLRSPSGGSYVSPSDTTIASQRPPLSSSVSSATRLNVATSVSEQARRMRDLLGMDAPSHRGRRNKNPTDLTRSLREDEQDDLTEEQLDQIAPKYNLATSLPVSMSPMFVKQEYEFERKTSYPNRERLLVPKLNASAAAADGKDARPSRPAIGRRSSSKSGAGRTGTRALPVLEEGESPAPTPVVSPDHPLSLPTADDIEHAGEQGSSVAIPGANDLQRESREEAATADVSIRSPPTPKEMSTTAAQDARIANRAAESDEEEDDEEEERDHIGQLADFVPPHIWSRQSLGEEGVLGTSVHDFE